MRPRAEHETLARLKRELAEYFDGRRRRFEVLLLIPYGETIAYEELARRVASPGAVRAVGQANGMNRIAIVVPCHRVVNEGGKLGGYGGGLWRKQRLLALEQGQRIDGLLEPATE